LFVPFSHRDHELPSSTHVSAREGEEPLLLIVFAIPVAIYLLILAHLNRGTRPVMVSGPWDFAGILFAASGFLLFGGPALLSTLNLHETWRRFWLLGKGAPGLTDDDRLFIVRLALFAVYFVVVVTASAFLLWRKRRVTAIYNVDPVLLEAVLDQVLERSAIPFAQTGNVLLFGTTQRLGGPPQASSGAPVSEGSSQEAAFYSAPLYPRSNVSDNDGLSAPPASHRPQQTVTLTVDAAPTLAHVTLIWNPADSLLRREIEGQLAHALEETAAPGSALGDWLLIVAYALFFFALLGFTVLALLWIFRY
jgi:hypothetical protein